MAIILTCNCGRTVQARNEDAGKQARCPACGTILTVPYPDEMPLPTREPLALPSEPVDAPTPTPSGLSPCSDCGGLFPSGDVFSNAGRLYCKRCHRDLFGGRERERDRERDRESNWDRDRDRDRDRGVVRRRDDDDYEDEDDERYLRRKVPDYLAPAIIVTILCCFLPGVPAIVQASKANTAAANGDYRSAHAAADSAKTWCWVSVIFGVICYLIVLTAVMADAGNAAPRGF